MQEGTLHLHAGGGFGLVSQGHNALSTALGTAVEVCLGVGQVVGEAAQKVRREHHRQVLRPASHNMHALLRVQQPMYGLCTVDMPVRYN